MKMKLYEILKNFVEKEAHIRMPKLEKCEYFEMTGIYHDDTMSEWCSDNNKQCENCKNHSCYQTFDLYKPCLHHTQATCGLFYLYRKNTA